MYEEWLSIKNEVLDEEKGRSVLHCFQPLVGVSVANPVIRNLAMIVGESAFWETMKAKSEIKIKTDYVL